MVKDLEYSKKLFLIAVIIGVLVLAYFLTTNQETESQIELKQVNPEEVCIDLVDMGFSNQQECLDFVNGMINKIAEYSDLDCQNHALLFQKLGVDCS